MICSYPSLDALLSSSPDYSCARTLFSAAPGPLVASRYPSATFFVPDNKAFSLYLTVLGVDNCTALAALGPAAVAALVSYHMIPNAAPTSGSLALGETPVPTGLEGYGLTITKESSSVVYVESAESKALATRRDVRIGTTSIAHVVDRVLVPYDLLAPPQGVQTWGTLGELLIIRNLTTSLTALQQIPVIEQLLKATDINATVFVPLDSAWLSLAFSGALSPRVLQVLQQQDATALEVATLLFGDHMHFGDSLNDTLLAARSSLAVGFGDYADPSAPVLRVAAAPAGGRLNVRLTGRTSALVTEPNYRVGAMTVHLVDSVLLTEATYARMEIIATPSYPTMAQAIQSQPDLSRFWAAVESASAVGGPSLMALMNDTRAPLTVFAPTDSALEALMEAASLSPRAQAISPDQLMLLIIRAHISVKSTYYAADLTDGQLIDVALNEGSTPLPSHSPRVKLASGQAPQLVTLTKAAVTRADTQGGGGVLHVLDGVLLPLRAAVLAGLFAGQPVNVTAEPGSLLAAMDNTPSTSVLASLVRGLGLAPTLSSATLAATLFAPSDFGFPDALVGLVDQGPANGTLPGMVDLPDALRQLLSDHLHVGARLLSDQLTDGQVLPMGPDPALYSPSTSVTVSVSNSTVALRSLLTAAVAQPDVLAGGMAVMHVVEGLVLLPAAAQALGLDIAPMPPPSPSEPAPSPAEGPSPDGPPPMYPNAIEALRADPSLSAFLGISQQDADLTAALSSPDTVATYFVPTDAALQGLLGGLAGRRRSLLQDDGDIGLPTYFEVIGVIVGSHLSFGRAILSTDIVNGTLVAVGEPNGDGPSPWNSPLLLVNDTGVFLMTVTAAKVIRPDITAGKAVIHVVDNLVVTLGAALLLSSVSPAPVPASPQPGSFLEAMQASADLSIVTAIAKQAGFGDTLSSASLSATLFAPDDASMQAVFQLIAQASSLSNSGVGVEYITGAVKELIGSHIHVGDRYTSNDLTDGQVIPMGADPARYSEGARVSVQVLSVDGVVSLASMEQSVVTRPDAVSSAFGALHVVQGAILTPAVAEAFGICNPCYASLLSALSDLDANSLLLLYSAAVDLPVVGDQLRQALQPPLTVFAPTEQAFAAYATARNTTLEAIAATPLAIAQIILPHLALGQQLPASALTDGTIVSTGDPRFFAAQLEVDVDAATGAVRVFRRGNPAAAATVLQADVTVGLPGRPDIIVHVIDKVIE